jgi:hypothetical protein
VVETLCSGQLVLPEDAFCAAEAFKLDEYPPAVISS